MKKCFIFCHGWGNGPYFWHNLYPYFIKSDYTSLDLGYFGKENLTVPEDQSMEYIGIGHSLGLVKLMSLKLKFKALIGIQGFVNFLGFDPILRKKREYDWNVLKKKFNTSPLQTLQTFYKRSQIEAIQHYKLENLNKNKLTDDLELLSLNFHLQNNIPLLILGAKDDVIVPPTLIYDNFSDISNVTIEMQERGCHMLGQLNPALTYKKIMTFLNDLYTQ